MWSPSFVNAARTWNATLLENWIGSPADFLGICVDNKRKRSWKVLFLLRIYSQNEVSLNSGLQEFTSTKGYGIRHRISLLREMLDCFPARLSPLATKFVIMSVFAWIFFPFRMIVALLRGFQGGGSLNTRPGMIENKGIARAREWRGCWLLLWDVLEAYPLNLSVSKNELHTRRAGAIFTFIPWARRGPGNGGKRPRTTPRPQPVALWPR